MGLLDRLLPWRRKTARLPDGMPSAAAVEAASEYYDGLYQERQPDPARFAELVAAHGLPDWPNPYPAGVDAHYRFHPDGFMFADLEAIVGEMVQDRQQLEGEEETPEDPVAWMDIAQASRQSMDQDEVFRKECAARATHCWAIALASGHPARRLASIIHPDNLWLVNMDVLHRAMEGQWPDVDAARVAEGMRQFVR